VDRTPDAPGFRLFGSFLCFATVMAALAAFLLLFPGTPLDRLWALNPHAYVQFASLGALIPWVGFGFIVLAVLGACTTRLWFQRRLLGWRLATIAIATQAIGDAVNFFRGERLAGLVGLIIASVLLAFLLSRRVKSAFY